MATTLNGAGVAHAHALVAQGKINTGKWDFTAEDGNKLLGPNGDDWANYGKWFLAIHPDADPKTKAHYGYPFGKNGEIYQNAVSSAKGRAAQQGATAIETACSSLMDGMGMGADKPAPGKSAKVERAYARLDVKAVQEDSTNYTITGIASTPVADRMGDVVEPMGAKFSLPMPLLWQHQADKPVGLVTFAKPTKSGIPFTATLPKVMEPGALRDRIEEAVPVDALQARRRGLDRIPVRRWRRRAHGRWRPPLSRMALARTQPRHDSGERRGDDPDHQIT